jgi:homospermidine synthase
MMETCWERVCAWWWESVVVDVREGFQKKSSGSTRSSSVTIMYASQMGSATSLQAMIWKDDGEQFGMIVIHYLYQISDTNELLPQIL